MISLLLLLLLLFLLSMERTSPIVVSHMKKVPLDFQGAFEFQNFQKDTFKKMLEPSLISPTPSMLETTPDTSSRTFKEKEKNPFSSTKKQNPFQKSSSNNVFSTPIKEMPTPKRILAPYGFFSILKNSYSHLNLKFLHICIHRVALYV